MNEAPRIPKASCALNVLTAAAVLLAMSMQPTLSKAMSGPSGTTSVQGKPVQRLSPEQALETARTRAAGRAKERAAAREAYRGSSSAGGEGAAGRTIVVDPGSGEPIMMSGSQGNMIFSDGSPSSPEGKVNLANRLYLTGDVERALDLLNEVVRENPKTPAGLSAAFRLATHALETGDHPRAAMLLRDLMESDERIGFKRRAEKMMVSALRAMGSYGEALKLVQSMIDSDEHGVMARAEKAAILKDMGDLPAAAAELQALLEQIQSEEAMTELFGIYRDMGTLDDRIAELAGQWEKAPSRQDLTRLLVRMYVFAGRPAEAAGVMAGHDRASPQGAPWHYETGLLYTRVKDHGKALDWYRRAADEEPAIVRYSAAVGEAMAALGRLDGAVAIWKRLEAGTRTPEEIDDIARTYYSHNLIDLAKNAYLNGRARFGNPALFSSELISLYGKKGDMRSLFAEMCTACAAEPYRAGEYQAILNEFMGGNPEAVPELSKIAVATPATSSPPETNLVAAWICRAANLVPKAIDYLVACSRARKDMGSLVLQFARELETAIDTDLSGAVGNAASPLAGATAAYGAIVKSFPGTPVAIEGVSGLARCLIRSGRPREALDSIRANQDAWGPALRGQATRLGIVEADILFEELGLSGEALEVLRGCVTPGSPPWMMAAATWRTARVLMAMGKANEALAAISAVQLTGISEPETRLEEAMTLYTRAVIEASESSFQPAQETLDSLIDQYPDTSPAADGIVLYRLVSMASQALAPATPEELLASTDPIPAEKTLDPGLAAYFKALSLASLQKAPEAIAAIEPLIPWAFSSQGKVGDPYPAELREDGEAPPVSGKAGAGDPLKPALAELLSRVYADSGDYASSAAVLALGARKFPGAAFAPAALLRAAGIYRDRLSDNARARRALEELIIGFPASGYGIIARQNLAAIGGVK